MPAASDPDVRSADRSPGRRLLANTRVRHAACFVGAAIVIATIALFVALRLRTSPDQLLAQALLVETSDPRQALSLLDANINHDARTNDVRGHRSQSQVVRCRVLLILRRADEAAASFERIERVQDCPADELKRLAHAAHVAGQLRLARRAFEAAGTAVTSKVDSLREMIEVLYALDDRAATIRHCREYARLVPEEAFPWLVAAGLHHENNSGSLAIEDYREALHRKLSDAEAARVRYQLVSLLMERGEIQEARQHCDQLLQASVDVNSNELVALINAELLYREGRSEPALSALNSLLAANPESLVALMIRGFLRFDAGDFALAIDDLQTVVRKDPFNQRAHYKLGQALQRIHQSDAAAIHLHRSEELITLSSEIMVTQNLLANTPDDDRLRLKLADLNEQRGDFKVAARWRGSRQQRSAQTGEH